MPVGLRETFLRGTVLEGQVTLARHQDSNGQQVPGSATLLARMPASESPVPAGTHVAVLSL